MVYFSKGPPAGRPYISPSERCGEEHQAASQDDKLKAQGEVDPELAGQICLNILESISDALKAQGPGRYAMHRADHFIEGYQTNPKEVLKDYIDGWSGMMTKQEAAL